nr:hypothetical protein CFP56_07806 [Quercus suber]
MVSTRQLRPADLSDSWDDVNTSHEDENGEPMFREDEEKSELREEYRSDRGRMNRIIEEERVSRRGRDAEGGVPNGKENLRRSARLSVEPELRMPSSPDGGRKPKESMRASTPHFRLNQRSLTSDAGKFVKEVRSSTPRIRRLNERSMTGDAGLFRRGASGIREEDEEDENDTKHAGADNTLWPRLGQPILRYAGDITGLAFTNAKPLLGWVLTAYVLGGLAIFALGFLSNSVNNALTPLCRVPGASLLHLPFCPDTSAAEIQGPAEFDKLVQVQSAFNDVLATTSIGTNLPLDMKRSEASIRDLKHVVQYSSLPSRNELVYEFTGFVELARQASRDLSKFNSRIGRAVDHILSTNRWTLTVIDGVGEKEAGRGAIARFVSNNLNIFAPFLPMSLSRDVLVDQYLRHTGAVEEQILALINEAEALLHVLDNLDGRLDVIASIATRDGIKIDANKEELFAYLWTKIGGNRSSVAKLENQISLLKEVGAYRRLAWAHVTTTVVKLQAIQHDLEDLRERVALPETVGIDRVPLEVHIDSINFGIARLEQQRDASRKAEADSYARILSRAEEGDKRLLDSGKEL